MKTTCHPPTALTLACAAALALAFSGCERRSETEEAVDEVGDKVEDAADEVEDAADDVTD